MGHINLISCLEGSQSIDNPGVEVAGSHIVFDALEVLPVFDKIDFDAFGVFDGVAHFPDFLLGRGALLAEFGKLGELVFDQAKPEAVQGGDGDDDDQDKAIAFSLGSFLKFIA